MDLMTRDEMLERLKKGEDPWDIVFDKWNRIKNVCKNNGEIDPSVFGSTCVLCEVRSVEYNAAIYCNGYEHGTLPCPLVQIGQRCSSNNAWGDFANNPTVDTTQKMIELLEVAKNNKNLS